MRPILPIIAAICYGQPSQPQKMTPHPREAFAWLLTRATAQKRIKLNIQDGTAAIEACGPNYRVLIIKDDSDEAKNWFNALSKDRGTVEGLLALGFHVVILVNQKHGTFIFNLTDSQMLPELSLEA